MINNNWMVNRFYQVRTRLSIYTMSCRAGIPGVTDGIPCVDQISDVLEGIPLVHQVLEDGIGIPFPARTYSYTAADWFKGLTISIGMNKTRSSL